MDNSLFLRVKGNEEAGSTLLCWSRRNSHLYWVVGFTEKDWWLLPFILLMEIQNAMNPEQFLLLKII